MWQYFSRMYHFLYRRANRMGEVTGLYSTCRDLNATNGTVKFWIWVIVTCAGNGSKQLPLRWYFALKQRYFLNHSCIGSNTVMNLMTELSFRLILINFYSIWLIVWLPFFFKVYSSSNVPDFWDHEYRCDESPISDRTCMTSRTFTFGAFFDDIRHTSCRYACHKWRVKCTNGKRRKIQHAPSQFHR